MADQLVVEDFNDGELSEDTPEHPLAEMAATLYDGNCADSPQADGPRGNTLVNQIIDRRSLELFDAAGVTEDQRDTLRADFAGIERETGLPDGVVIRLAEAFIDGKLAEARSKDPLALEETINQRSDELNEEYRTELRLRLGPKDAEDLLERTRRFCRTNPKLQLVLQAYGLGSRREIVEAIAGHVHSTGYR